MGTTSLTYEQNSVVNAVLTLINSMDGKMRDALLAKLSRRGKSKATTKGKAETTKAKDKSLWYNYPVSDEVMAMTFKHRKPVPEDYKTILEDELREKYK